MDRGDGICGDELLNKVTVSAESAGWRTTADGVTQTPSLRDVCWEFFGSLPVL